MGVRPEQDYDRDTGKDMRSDNGLGSPAVTLRGFRFVDGARPEYYFRIYSACFMILTRTTKATEKVLTPFVFVLWGDSNDLVGKTTYISSMSHSTCIHHTHSGGFLMLCRR